MENPLPDTNISQPQSQDTPSLSKKIFKGVLKTLLYFLLWFGGVFLLGLLSMFLGVQFNQVTNISLVLWGIGFLIILVTALVRLNRLIKARRTLPDIAQSQSTPKKVFVGVSRSIVRIFIALLAWYFLPLLAVIVGLPWLYFPLSYGVPIVLVILVLFHFTKSIKTKSFYQTEQPKLSLKEIIFRGFALLIFGLISLFSALFFFSGGGWEFLIYRPIAIIFTPIFIIGQLNLIRKIRARYFTIFSVAFLNIITLFSLRINTPIMTDGPGIYWLSSFFGGFGYQNLEDFKHPFLGVLFLLSIIYFIGGFYLLFSRPFKNKTILNEIIVIVIGVVLITSHAIPVIQRYPNLLQGKENAEVLNTYETTFIEREFSFVYLENPKPSSDCPYARNYYDKLKSIENFDKHYTVTCKKEIATWDDITASDPTIVLVKIPYTISIPEYESGKPQYKGQLYIPLRTRQEPSTGYPSDVEMIYKQGDVLAITVKVSPALIVYVDVPGNDGVSHRGSEAFVPQHTSEATLTLFYPINIPKVDEGKDIEWAYITFDPTFGEMAGTVLEVALISQE